MESSFCDAFPLSSSDWIRLLCPPGKVNESEDRLKGNNISTSNEPEGGVGNDGQLFERAKGWLENAQLADSDTFVYGPQNEPHAKKRVFFLALLCPKRVR